MMSEQEFEEYWKENRERILRNDQRYVKSRDRYKMSSGADWLLFGVPVIVGILFMNNVHISNELLKWAASAGVTIVAFVISVWIKSLTIDNKSPDEIEEEIKERVRKGM